eukprot:TRINITY_DN67899_c3_g3_i2.p2 TRINITY_DN67899_c3_g3~~TRINITY_DN67899_c3_g3_i2.p2  ORF type:complete len:118 (-),score=20.27 TRINITY_DN67899_c3_g3_i2:67-420(-)
MVDFALFFQSPSQQVARAYKRPADTVIEGVSQMALVLVVGLYFVDEFAAALFLWCGWLLVALYAVGHAVVEAVAMLKMLCGKKKRDGADGGDAPSIPASERNLPPPPPPHQIPTRKG